MKNYPLVILLFVLSPHLSFAQPVKGLDEMMSLEELYKAKKESLSDLTNPYLEKAWKQFKRWEYMNEPYFNGGQPINPVRQNIQALQQVKKDAARTPSDNPRVTNGQWTSQTPTDWTIDSPNNGRVNVIAVHPSNDDIIYIGTAIGGLWKSTDAGVNWTSLTSGLPVIGISGIAIHPTAPNLIFILTGDGDGRHTPSVGILRSIDGGLSWQETGYTVERDDLHYGYKLLMHPTQPNIMYAATSQGLFRTDDNWVSYTEVIDASMRDIEFKPGNPGTVYASSWRGLYVSDDNGMTWANKVTEPGSNLPGPDSLTRVAIAVSPDQPSWVYALFAFDMEGNGFRGLYVSFDSGEEWFFKSDNPNIVGNGNYNQVGYDLEIVVHPEDASNVIAGGINLYESTSSGNQGTWTSYVDADIIHSDVHHILYTSNYIYIAGDGGMSRSDDDGATWVNISEGLSISQFYDLDVLTNRVLAGSQDNGTSLWDIGDAQAVRELSADGLDCFFDPTDLNVMYASTQNNRYRTDNAGSSWMLITPPGDTKIWSSPFQIHPTDYDTIYSTFNTFWRSYNKGDSWTDTNPGFANSIKAMAQGVSVPNRMYAASRLEIKKTSNIHAATPVWENITPPVTLNPNSLLIGSISVNSSFVNRIFLTLLNYSDGNKVFYSEDAGDTWVNISFNLPNIPVHCSVYDPVHGGVYIGTDIGVFYMNFQTLRWVYFSNGMPTTRVSDLKIHDNNLYAATFGRGIWRSGLYTLCNDNLVLSPENDPSDGTSTGRQDYEADNSIISTRKILGGIGTHVTYSAGNTVRLDPGFHVKSYNKLDVILSGCSE